LIPNEDRGTIIHCNDEFDEITRSKSGFSRARCLESRFQSLIWECRVKCFLFKWKNQDTATLMIPRLIRKPKVIQWPAAGDRTYLGDALFHVEFLTQEGEVLRTKFAATRGLKLFGDDFKRLVNAEDVGAIGLKKQLKDLGSQAQGLMDGAQGAINKLGSLAATKVKRLKEE